MGSYAARCQPATRREQASRQPGGQVAPVSAHQGQVRDVAHPHPVGGGRRGLSQQAVFGDNGGGVGHDGAEAMRVGIQLPQPVPVQPRAQRIASYGMALGAQFLPHAEAVAPGVTREGRLCRHLPRSGRRLGTNAPLTVIGAADAQHGAEPPHGLLVALGGEEAVAAHGFGVCERLCVKQALAMVFFKYPAPALAAGWRPAAHASRRP